MITPTHVHSEYSALDGFSKVEEIAARCKDLGCPCCALTDHHVVAGHLKFDKVMRENDIKPIFGVEAYHGNLKEGWGKNERDQSHLILLAQTSQGLKNLWTMMDLSSEEENFRYVPRVTWDLLREYNEGIIATSACIQGMVPQGVMNDDLSALNQYLEIFGDRFYIALSTYDAPDQEDLNIGLVSVADERGIPCVVEDDAHFASPEQYEAHDIYMARQMGDTIYTEPDERKMWHPPNSLYIKGADEIRSDLSYLPDHVIEEAIDNNNAIGEMCEAELPDVRRHLPVFIPAECPWLDDEQKEQYESNADLLFIDLVEQGIYDRYGEDPPEEVWDRAEREIDVFLTGGLTHYFLLEWDKNQFCDYEKIERGPGRGSAAGSIVSYALKITDVDPLKYGLIFERFYNPGRAKGFPDIDSDYPTLKRKDIKAYLQERWGHNQVRSIGTVRRLKPLAALNEFAKPFLVRNDELAAIKKIVEQTPDLDILGSDSIGWDREVDPGKIIYVMDHVGADLAEYIDAQEEDRQDVLYGYLDLVRTICNRASGYGVHASGVVVSDSDLRVIAPCRIAENKSTGEKTQATQFPMDDIDALQLVKLDNLGLRNLDTLQDWADQMASEDVEIEWSGLEDRESPEEMWELLDRGLALGVFQLEDGYGARLAKDLQPRNIEDLALIVGLNRPGPIRSGAPDSFIIRRHGGEDDKFDGRKIPLLQPILEDTFGWFLWQEQVIEYFGALGYGVEDADAVRKILGKKKPEDLKALYSGEGEWKGKDYLTFAKAAGLAEDLANEIWEKLEDFAKYSFNKSHAICYAVLGYRTLYAKWREPEKFFLACIRTNPKTAGKYIAEARRMAIEIHPPNIDHSQEHAYAKPGAIYLGFYDVKGVRKAGAYVVKLRDELGYDLSSPDLLDEALDAETVKHKAKAEEVKLKGKQYKVRSPRQQLGSDKIVKLWEVGAWDEYESRDWNQKKIQETEAELLGVVITDDSGQILMNNEDEISECDYYEDISDSAEKGTEWRIPGVISEIRETRTKKDNKAMGIIVVEYGSDVMEFAVFSNKWKSFKRIFRERTPGIFTIARNDRGYHYESGVKLT